MSIEVQVPTPIFPAWLHVISIIALLIAGTCAALIAIDELRRPQPMWIMNLVWPLTALFGSVLWLAAYWWWGRAHAGDDGGRGSEPTMAVAVLKGASHCGAGCTLGDIIAEWLAFAVPGVAVALGWRSLFEEKMFAVWIADFILAFLLGVLFQYFTIKPMRKLSTGEGLIEALKADTASIASWQIGMYGFMAAAQLLWLKPTFGRIAPVDTPEFWFVMQIAMLCGFTTSYPVNWLLVRIGVKERM